MNIRRYLGVTSNFMFSFVPGIYGFLSVHINSPWLDIVPCQYEFTKINVTTIGWIVLEVIRVVSTVNHTGDSTIYSIRICTISFLQIELEFTSDREDLLVEICILLSLVIFGTRRRGEKLGNK